MAVMGRGGIHTGYLLTSAGSSLHMFTSSINRVCCIGSYCSSVSFLPSLLLFSVVPFFLPPSSDAFPVILPPHLSCSRTLCAAFFLLLALPPPSILNLRTLLFSFFSLLCPLPPPPHPPLLFWMYCRGEVADASLPGFWGAAGVCNDHGKTYALYTITVFRRNQDASEDCWKTYRRYSDFHDFHMRITEQVRVCEITGH